MVRSTLTKVFHILEDETFKDPAKLIPRRHMLEEVVAFAPKMKLIKAGVRDVKAKRHAVSRLDPNPDGVEGIHKGRPS